MLKNITLIVATALVCLASFVLYQRWIYPTDHKTVDSTVLLERVDKVFKLVAVEGNFSEIYTYKNHLIADIWPLRKKAMLQVVARVSIGYDLEDVEISLDEEQKTMRISGPLRPEILSLEHDIKSYDFENGLFNMITDQDITKMGDEVKQAIADKALESDLYIQAEGQKAELLDMLQWMLKASGWRLIVEEEPILD